MLMGILLWVVFFGSIGYVFGRARNKTSETAIAGALLGPFGIVSVLLGGLAGRIFAVVGVGVVAVILLGFSNIFTLVIAVVFVAVILGITGLLT